MQVSTTMAMNTCRPIAALFFLCIILLGGVGEIGVLSWKLCAGCSMDTRPQGVLDSGGCHHEGDDVERCPLTGIPETFCCGRCKPEKERTVRALPPSITFRFICPDHGEDVAFPGCLRTDPVLRGTSKLRPWNSSPLVPPPKDSLLTA